MGSKAGSSGKRELPNPVKNHRKESKSMGSKASPWGVKQGVLASGSFPAL